MSKTKYKAITIWSLVIIFLTIVYILKNNILHPSIVDVPVERTNKNSSYSISKIKISQLTYEFIEAHDGTEMYGIRYELTFILPEKIEQEDNSIGIQLNYSKNISDILGCSATGISYSYISENDYTKHVIFDRMFPSNESSISKEDLYNSFKFVESFSINIYNKNVLLNTIKNITPVKK